MANIPKKFTKGEPLVVGVEHGPHELSLGYSGYVLSGLKDFLKKPYLPLLNETAKNLKSLFQKLAEEHKGRTLFIEMDKKNVEAILRRGALAYHQSEIPEPFAIAIHLADSYGWRIRPLDSVSSRPIASKWVQGFPIGGYIMHNLREGHWAAKVRKNAKADDIVLMHPNHIGGFLEKTGLSAKTVVWIDKQILPVHWHKYVRRLTAEEEGRFRILRNAARALRTEGKTKPKVRKKFRHIKPISRHPY